MVGVYCLTGLTAPSLPLKKQWTSPMRSQTGREIAMQRLLEAARLSTAGDIQRAAMFLERAREVRGGCRTQRGQARRAQATAWEKKVDPDVRWK